MLYSFFCCRRYEVDFPNEALGFRVRPVAGLRIAVSLVKSPSLAGVVSVNDFVIAVNGAPLGAVTDPAALAKRLGPLRRPVNITFERFDPTRGDAAASDLAGEVDAFSPAETPAARIGHVFAEFDADGSGDLDTFELAHAIEALTGRAPPSAEVAALVKASGAAATNNSLTLAQFTFLVRTFDWAESARLHNSAAARGLASDATASGLGPRQYEHTFMHESLGFQVRAGATAGRGRVVVAGVTAPALHGVVASGDAVLAVNGAPLGWAVDPKVCDACVSAGVCA